MRLPAALLATALVSGCATSPDVLCDHRDIGLQVLATPPDEAGALVSALERSRPNAVVRSSERAVWLRDDAGNLYLCTYRKRPVSTGTCGATVQSFIRDGDRYTPGSASISACH